MEKQGLPVWDWDRGQAPVPGLIFRELYKIAQGLYPRTIKFVLWRYAYKNIKKSCAQSI
jgi:hypothetical protein